MVFVIQFSPQPPISSFQGAFASSVLGGAAKAASGVARLYMGDLFGGITGLVSGVTEIFSGIGIYIETDIEKAERLTKEAEKAVLEAKKLKAETNTL